MKKVLLIATLTVCLMGTPSIAHALIFTLDQSQLLQLYETDENPTPQVNTFLLNSNSLVTSFGGYTSSEGAIAAAYLLNSDSSWQTFQQISIGVNSSGNSTDGTTILSTGNATPGSIGAGNLTGYSEYQLVFHNLDDDDWLTSLYMITGPSNTLYTTSWLTLSPDEWATAKLDLAGVSNLDQVKSIGFNIGTAWDGTRYHYNQAEIEVAPIPEPTSMLLLGIGLIGLAGKKVRKRFKA